MKFEYPQFFYAFFLLLIPIIIHLFHFRRYKTLYFSSLAFVKQVDEETKSTQKLKHLLVLFSRLLALSFLIIAFAQPYVPVDAEKKAGYPLLGIFVDNSFSMGQKGAEGELLSMAKEKARQFVSKADPSSRFIVFTNAFEGIEQNVMTKADALDKIDKIDFAPFSKRSDEVLTFFEQALQKNTEESAHIGQKQLVLLSDFQVHTSKIDKKFNNTFSVFPVQLLAQANGNLAIDSVWFEEPNHKIGVNNTINVRIKNFGEQKLINNELHLKINEHKRDVFFDVNPKETTIVPITYADYKAGFKNGSILISDKGLYFDDEFYFSYTLKDKCAVLIVDGEDAVTNIPIVYGLDEFYQVKRISVKSFKADDLEKMDLVVLNGLNSYESGLVSSFNTFSKNGGTIAVFPGKSLNLGEFNAWMNELDAPSFASPISTGIKVKTIEYDDPFYKGMFERKPEKLNLPAFSKVYAVRKNAATSALISLQNGMPVFMKTTGSKQLYLFASSLVDDFGNFKSNALFSSILLRVGETSQRNLPLFLTIGSDAMFPIYDLQRQEKPLHLKNKEMDFIPEMVVSDGVTKIGLTKNSLNQQLKAGVYAVESDKVLTNVALNYDRLESDTKACTQEELKAIFDVAGVKNTFVSSFSDSLDSALIKIEKPIEYWRLALFLALFFLVIEMSLLKFFK